MADREIPKIYGNVIQVTRTPWDVTLFIMQGMPPRGAKKGDTVKLIDTAEDVARVTLPLAVAKELIRVLTNVTSDEAIKIIQEEPSAR